MRRLLFIGLLLFGLGGWTSFAQSGALSPTAARAVFDEAKHLSERDNGETWGIPLYGPMLLVDRALRDVIANRPVAELRSEAGVYVGSLPDSLGVANTATDWAGTQWTMLVWPLPEDSSDRRALIAHELWHRVQDELGFPSSGAPNLHLGTRDGRVWLQLEWRALSTALQSTGDEMRRHLIDALVFRAQRMEIFPGAAEEERLLVMHEGLAQYTGYRMSGRTASENRVRAVREIESMNEMPTFIRSFAYPTGAAYGLLLDVLDPDWRKELTASDDLAVLAGRAVGFEAQGAPDSADRVLDRYDGAALMEAEDRKEAERESRLDAYRRRFVEGPVLDLGFIKMNVQFDPGEVDALGDLGKVYPSLRLTDEWGTLQVDGGALITADWSRVIVPSPQERTERGYVGDGYTLELAEGWMLVAGPRVGDRVVWHEPRFMPTEVSFKARDGVTVFGDFYLEHGRSAPLILLFHQGASNARAEYLPISQRLIDAGFNLLAIDQRRGGDRFGGENRTVAGTPGVKYSYCDCYADLEAALHFARSSLEATRVIAWGSSYSAALVFKLGADHPEEVDRILAFSPATGEPMEGCRPEPYAEVIEVPALVLRPASEMKLEHVSSQFETLRGFGHKMYVADPAVHGSSMLNPNRVLGDTGPAWQVVLEFLSPDG